MGWAEALERVVAATGHERYRVLCGDDHPDRDAWRAEVVRLAIGGPVAVAPRPAPAATGGAYPPAGRQLAGLARSLFAWAKDGFRLAAVGEYRRRRAICGGCPLLDRAHDRCTKCGCSGALKPWIAREACPDHRW